METDMKCPICGKAMQHQINGSTQGFYCNECDDWGVVTTFIPDIQKDVTVYRIILLENTGDIGKIRAVAKTAGVNFIRAKELLGDGLVEIASGGAPAVKSKVELLESAGVIFKVSPDFPYL